CSGISIAVVTAMNKKVVWLVTLLLLVSATFAGAQQPAKIPRIGYLDGAPLSAARTEAFREGLRELGYIDGKNIMIEWKSADGKVDRLAVLVAELGRLKVAVILSAAATGTPTAKPPT